MTSGKADGATDSADLWLALMDFRKDELAVAVDRFDEAYLLSSIQRNCIRINNELTYDTIGDQSIVEFTPVVGDSVTSRAC